MLAKLDHCVIHVSDWERPDVFYRDVLGAELIDRGAGTWAYRFGTEQLNVHGPGADPGPVARIPVAPGNSDLCFEWPGPIESASTHLRTHNIQVEQGPESRNGAKGQGTSVYFRDPDGVAACLSMRQPLRSFTPRVGRSLGSSASLNRWLV
jgi:catechol 2,3-dioxygenase-like lactoylglutathione lyase family enzyme